MGLINTTSPQVSGNTLPHTVVTISTDWTSTSLEVIHSRCVQVTDINKHELTVDPRLQHPTLPTHSYSSVYPFILGSFTHYIRNYLVLEDFNQELAAGFRFCFLIYCLTNRYKYWSNVCTLKYTTVRYFIHTLTRASVYTFTASIHLSINLFIHLLISYSLSIHEQDPTWIWDSYVLTSPIHYSCRSSSQATRSPSAGSVTRAAILLAFVLVFAVAFVKCYV